MDTLTLAVDAMGGDYGPSVTVPASLLALDKYPELHIILVGDRPAIERCLSKKQFDSERLVIQHAEEVVEMDELPSVALRSKKKSSMRKCVNLVHEKQAKACISAGNTGALMAIARFVLKTLPGVDRPAIISELPCISGKTRVLDLGANVDSCAEHLFQFAVMGTVLVNAVEMIDKPKVGLLNIGVEEIKGNDQVKRTAQLLAENPFMNYVGYVEGTDIFKGVVDLVVCDGFVGNVALKASEGTAKLLSAFLKEAFSESLLSRCMAWFAKPVLNRFKKRMDPSRYNGASLLGLNGIVVKSHGAADVIGFRHAIEQAIVESRGNIPNMVREQVADFLIT